MVTMKRIVLFIALISIITATAHAQTKMIDSLRHTIHAASDRTIQLNSIYLLADQPINADTLYPYILLAEKLTAAAPNSMDADKTAFCRASYYARKEFTDSALYTIDELAKKYKGEPGQPKFYLQILFFRAKILDRANHYTDAISQLVQVVQLAEAQKDTLIQIQAKTGIGWVQMEMEQYPEALNWLTKALHTSSDKKFYNNYGALYSNIASTYNSLGNTDSARYYIDMAIADARKNENILFLATALSIKAKILIDGKQGKLAEAPLHEALELRRILNDPFYIVYDMSSLASYYAHNNQPEKGIALCNEGIELARKSGLTSQLLMIYRSLAENYKASGNIAEYSKTLEDIIRWKDSFNTLNSSKQIAELQGENEIQKKENTIIEQKLDITVKNYWLIGSLVFAGMGATIFFLAFKNYRRKQQVKMQLALEKEKQIAAQSVMEAEEQERKRIAADLHDNIGAYATAIRAEVEKITGNSLPSPTINLRNLQQHSQEIINSLRDTIWVLNKEHITITGISDRIKNYLGKLEPTYSNIQFNITEDIQQDVRVSSQMALNIFRIVQESVHNALKHSSAKNINIRIDSRETASIQITDDGGGIESTGTQNDARNGMVNMQARAVESGMALKIMSKPNEGTCVSIAIPTIN